MKCQKHSQPLNSKSPKRRVIICLPTEHFCLKTKTETLFFLQIQTTTNLFVPNYPILCLPPPLFRRAADRRHRRRAAGPQIADAAPQIADAAPQIADRRPPGLCRSVAEPHTPPEQQFVRQVGVTWAIDLHPSQHTSDRCRTRWIDLPSPEVS